MHTIPLNAQTRADPRTLERGEEAAIAGEIARHLLEYSETTSKSRCVMLIQKLGTLAALDPPTLFFTLRLLSGDLSEVTRSYSDLGKESGRSKQAVQQEIERSLAKLRLYFPELEQALVSLRQITAHYDNGTSDVSQKGV